MILYDPERRLQSLLDRSNIKSYIVREFFDSYSRADASIRTELAGEIKKILDMSLCDRCGLYMEGVCQNCLKLTTTKRQLEMVIVETPITLLNIPIRPNYYFFSLGGLLNYIKNIDSKNLRFNKLVTLVKEFAINRAVIVLADNLNGRGTMQYTRSILRRFNVSVSYVPSYHPESSFENVSENFKKKIPLS